VVRRLKVHAHLGAIGIGITLIGGRVEYIQECMCTCVCGGGGGGGVETSLCMHGCFSGDILPYTT
jgi:hypothetical protein